MRYLALAAVTFFLTGLQPVGWIADERAAPYVEPYAVPPAHYKAPPPPAPARDAPKKDDKRGNTPPGMDRTGGGPASGAILDPTGAVTKEPVLRER